MSLVFVNSTNAVWEANDTAFCLGRNFLMRWNNPLSVKLQIRDRERAVQPGYSWFMELEAPGDADCTLIIFGTRLCCGSRDLRRESSLVRRGGGVRDPFGKKFSVSAGILRINEMVEMT